MENIFKLVLCLIVIIPIFVNGIYVGPNLNITISRETHKSFTPANCDESEDGIWSSILEDWTINQNNNYREGRVIQSHHKYIPTNGGFYITKRMGEAIELNSPNNNMINNRRPVIQSSSSPPLGYRQNYGHPTESNNMQSSQREVTETDLYLLGAIEKLVFRVDYMEKRLRRVEQLMYYVMAGNNQKEDPCPDSFTRIGENCYHIGVKELNWKSANLMCRSLSSNLAELETSKENQDIVIYLLNQQQYKGRDFWLGGLNPGLLWIWSNSAKPVNPNTNLTSISNFSSNSSSTSNIPPKAGEKISNSVINNNDSNTFEIKGSGRCLRLSYNPTLHKYMYTGQECTSRHSYLCEYKERHLDNEISRIAKELDIK